MSTSAAVVTALPLEGVRRLSHEKLLSVVPQVREFIAPPAAPVRTVTAEQEAYERGLADGHRRGAEVSAASVAATIARLSASIREIENLRTAFLKRSEQDIVRLSLAIAHRVLQRETSVDPGLLLQLARAAVEKLSTTSLVTIEMHPDDLAAASADTTKSTLGPVELVANPRLTRGACVVQSSAGTIDLCINSQIQEILDTLIRDDAAR